MGGSGTFPGNKTLDQKWIGAWLLPLQQSSQSKAKESLTLTSDAVAAFVAGAAVYGVVVAVPFHVHAAPDHSRQNDNPPSRTLQPRATAAMKSLVGVAEATGV